MNTMEFYFLQLPSYISLGICGLVGILFLYIHIKKIIIDIKISNILILLSLSSIIVQVLIVVLFQSMGNEIGSFSMFYNVINLFILTFLYIYRNEMKLNYYLYWSFALLFLMGMEIRALQTLKLGLLDAI
jgi:hypothetical protein